VTGPTKMEVSNAIDVARMVILLVPALMKTISVEVVGEMVEDLVLVEELVTPAVV